MDLSNEIILEKYKKEILLVKNVILGKLSNNISDLKFLEILKVILNNNNMDENDFEKISEALEIEELLLKKVYEEFYNDSNKINILNFDFPRHLLEETKFEKDSDVIKNIINILTSSRKNIEILKEFKPIDLISKDHLEALNSFMISYIFDGKIKKSIENLIRELKHHDKFVLIKAKLKDEYNYLLRDFKREFNLLSQENEYYSRILYPYISLHDKATLKEIVTIKLESIDIKYL